MIDARYRGADPVEGGGMTSGTDQHAASAAVGGDAGGGVNGGGRAARPAGPPGTDDTNGARETGGTAGRAGTAGASGRTGAAKPSGAADAAGSGGRSAAGTGTGTDDGAATSRRERRERTRTALLVAAQRLWAERGVHGASLDDVAAEAGLTKGAVYSNFTGKTDLLLALLERWTGAGIGTETYTDLTGHPADGRGRTGTDTDTGADTDTTTGSAPDEPYGSGEESADERFERAGHAYARRMSGEAARLVALLLVEFWLYGMRDPRAGERLADWYAERRAVLAEDLRDTGGISATDRAALAVALDFGLAMQHLLDPDRVPAELYAHGMRLVLGKAVA